jgi:histidinol-phosphate/aromatic aminotransferase/cobyric acid decarboxylase-like protein
MQLKDKNHYPEYGELQKALAEYCKVDEDQTLLTNGSDQAIIDSGAGPEILRLLAQRIPEQ